MRIEDANIKVDIDGIEPWQSKRSILIWLVLQLSAARKDITDLKSEVEKFLRPQIRFYVGNQIARRIKMKDTEKVVASLELDDAKGFPTGGAFDQPPVWTSDDSGAFVALTPSADGLTCSIAGVAPGNANVSVAGVAAGVSYVGTVPVPVVAGDATAIKISLGAATAQ